MKKISLYFQIHQPYRLRRYRFFDIGNAHYYNDDYTNEEIFQRIANECYYPATRTIEELIENHDDFKVNFVISGLAIEQMEYHTPQLISDIRRLVDTGRVEILCEPYAHSISSLYDHTEFREQIKMMKAKINELFDVEPKVFCNTELIYDDTIGDIVSSMGFKGVIIDNAKHVMGWKSPNYLYSPYDNKKMKILVRNSFISDTITNDFSRYDSAYYPITVEKILDMIEDLPDNEKFVNLFMNYEIMGSIHRKESGIFEFFKALPQIAKNRNISFATASEIVDDNKTIGELSVSNPISSYGEEKNVGNWVGNILQQGAIRKLEEWGERIRSIEDNSILQDWLYLQASDHFYYMSTLGDYVNKFSPYKDPYDAFNNYMNVLSDLLIRAEEKCPNTIDTEELNSYQRTISNQDKEIDRLKKEIARLKNK